MNARDRFSLISSVRPDAPETWNGRIFVTFDLDWAHDEVVEYAVDMVEQSHLPATWFITHDTPILSRLRSNPNFELGIHPNFLPLLMDADTHLGATAAEVLGNLLTIVPEARSVRCHSLVQSGPLLKLFRDSGLTHDANVFIPEQSHMSVAPWADWYRIIKVPYIWEDDFWCDTGCVSSIDQLVKRTGMIGFNFHPIHVFLNSERLSRYENARAMFHDPRLLEMERFQGQGTRTMLSELLSAGQKRIGND